MTREEEIQRKAGELADFGISHYQPNQQQYYEGFIDGAKWADKHPKEGLWDAEKVKQFLRDNTMFGNHPTVFDEFIKSLIQYMED